MTREFLGLRMWNFQGIVFIWTQTYREIFKSALVYLYVRSTFFSKVPYCLQLPKMTSLTNFSRILLMGKITIFQLCLLGTRLTIFMENLLFKTLISSPVFRDILEAFYGPWLWSMVYGTLWSFNFPLNYCT